MRKLLTGVLAAAIFVSADSARAAGDEGVMKFDIKKAGAKISPYLYGQFIEHLGRCIRGGIWAEMLHDRKFLLEPGKSWTMSGPEGADFEVKHDKAAAYAGDNGIAIHVRNAGGGQCGIRQGGLGLIAGKEYAGYAVLAVFGGRVPVEIRLSWGDGPEAGKTLVVGKAGPVYRKYKFRFRAGATTDEASLSITLSGPGSAWVGCVSLMPSNNLRGMRPDTLKLIKDLAPPITRWPGGNFVSGYDWKDGIGDRDRRPPRWERAWNAVEDNDFGLDEFMAFCREVDTEPYIAVNAGLGSASEAADEVEYANGSARSRWGRERVRNGYPSSYSVMWWGIGNEMWGEWQLGNIPVEQYTLRNNAFAQAMRAKDPEIKIIAVGAPGKWNDVVLPACASHMDLISGHYYTQRRLGYPFSPQDAEKYRDGFQGYSEDLLKGIRGMVEDLRKRVNSGRAEVDRVRLAIDEWGLLRDWDQRPDAPGLGSFECYYPMGDAVVVARGLNEILRSADIVAMANWAQTVNVIGLIKTSKTRAAMSTAGHVLALYRKHLIGAVVPVEVPEGASIDAAAAWDAKSRTLSLGLVNYSPDESRELSLVSAGGGRLWAVKAWRIEGDLLTDNEPGKPEEIGIRKLAGKIDPALPMSLPPASVTVVSLKVR